jgi:hypothetical protein
MPKRIGACLLSFVRQARMGCAQIFAADFQNLGPCGKLDPGEIAILSVVENGFIDSNANAHQFVGKSPVAGYDRLRTASDTLMIPDDARQTFDQAVKICGARRLLAPKLPGLPTSEREWSAQ